MVLIFIAQKISVIFTPYNVKWEIKIFAVTTVNLLLEYKWLKTYEEGQAMQMSND